MSTDTKSTDWTAAANVADALGRHTLHLVARRDLEQAREWALQMSTQNVGVRSISYYELAVLLGHDEKAIQDHARQEWNQLLRQVKALQATVRVKADAEARATAEADAAAANAKTKKASDEPPEPRGSSRRRGDDGMSVSRNRWTTCAICCEHVTPHERVAGFAAWESADGQEVDREVLLVVHSACYLRATPAELAALLECSPAA
jgi:hypothetical protein